MNLNQRYKLWLYTTHEYVDSLDPRPINYKTGLTTSLHPVYSIESGYLTEVDYLSEHENSDTLVLRVNMDYNEEKKTRITTRKYVIEGEEIIFGDLVKKSEKFYTDSQWELVQLRRRQNIVNELTSQATTFGILPFVQELWRVLSAELSAYISTGDTTLLTDISTYSHVSNWLEYPSSIPNVTLRQIIIGQLSI